MTRSLHVEQAGPAVSVQDAGRSGGLGLGLSRGGAADRHAYFKGIALLRNDAQAAAIEMAGLGGRFRFDTAARFALTGARFRATIGGVNIEPDAVHLAGAGDVLEVGGASEGVYGYLHIGGGIDTPVELGGRGFHRIAGLGRAITAGDTLPLGTDPHTDAPPMRLEARPAATGPVRVMPGPQTALFPPASLAAFEAAFFTRSPKANRQGVRLDHDGAPFATASQLNQVSDFIAEGDIQMTGDGTPFVLLADCQTMGGYPRIGTVLPADLPRIAQAMPGDSIRFSFVSEDEAGASWQPDAAIIDGFRKRCVPRVRDPREMNDLLSYELIDRPGEEITGTGDS